MQSEPSTLVKPLTEEKARQMLEAGVHFGQPTSKRSPKMDPFVYGLSANGIQIIDLNKTWFQLHKAGEMIQRLASEDKNILFVGTNERAISGVLQEYADKYDLHHITNRWLGGTLTNPVTRNRINYLRELEGMEQSGLIDSISAKEKSFIGKKLKKLRKNLGGLKNIKGVINAIVLLDPVHEQNATLEALKKKRNMVIIAIADTNCHFNTELFDLVVPCNVSSMRSLRTVMDVLMEYLQAGRKDVHNRPQAVSGSMRRRPAGAATTSPAAALKPASNIQRRDLRTKPTPNPVVQEDQSQSLPAQDVKNLPIVEPIDNSSALPDNISHEVGEAAGSTED